ncbi:MAG TPA: DUF1702 family protein [Acidobacteriota bacterium]|nr:DUF1702 family protein [Acidobacteriota bacterium]
MQIQALRQTGFSGSGFLSAQRLRTTILSRPPASDLASRGFRGGEQAARDRLDRAAATFMQGYRLALRDVQPQELTVRLNRIENAWRGFAFEGAAMALALLDKLSFSRRDRLVRFSRSQAKRHIYMIHVGFGWALARFPWKVEKQAVSSHALLGWLALDGFGFHQGFFRTSSYVERRKRPRGLSSSALRVVDQGLGRSLWFVKVADPRRIAETISRFDSSRRPDLWSGVGLACAYAGAPDAGHMRALIRGAEATGAGLDFRQGVAFAAAARERAGNPAPHTESASRFICGKSPEELSQLCEQVAQHPSPKGSETLYEAWRRGLREALADSAGC